MLPHSIRLRGPWQVQIEPQPAVQVVLPATPAELGLAAAVGSVWRLLRRFGLPRTLDPHESVWLCLQQVQGLLSLKVNDQSYDCPAEELIEIELGHALNPRNSLSLEVRPTDPHQPIFSTVELSIRGRVRLRQLRAERAADGVAVAVSGQVVGPATEHLEVYVLAQRQTVAHRPVSADPQGVAFAVLTDPLPPAVDRVRVELVCVSSVWHSQELLIRS
jgi:hypothetical protein